MRTQFTPLPAKQIGNYPINSSGMDSSKRCERKICVYDDPDRGLRIWGEATMEGAANSIDLCQVFLEYALFCQKQLGPERAYKKMKSFSENLGRKLAEYVKATPVYSSAKDPSACTLESTLEAIHSHVTIEHVGPELQFVITGCTLLNTSRYDDLPGLELAQYGFNTMCQSLIHTIDPHVLLYVPLSSGNCQVFTLVRPIPAALEGPPYPITIHKVNPLKKDSTPPPVIVKKTPADFPARNWSDFLIATILPITIANIISGAIMVGVLYWLIYLRRTSHSVPQVTLETTQVR